MTDKLKCPFCGAELNKEEVLLMPGHEIRETGRLLCTNSKCPMCDQRVEPDVWKLLIDGKKAQDALKKAKEYYVIYQNHTSPHGIHKAFISYCTGVDWFWNYDIDRAEPFDCVADAKQQIRCCKIPGARLMKVRRFTEIASITTQGEDNGV